MERAKSGLPSTLPEWVDRLQTAGRYAFGREEAKASLRLSPIAFKSALRRLLAKGRVVSPRRGFYVIVPLEYRTAGGPPASWFVDPWLAFQRRPYYVGLLSAAAIHGAAHQQPQELQVISDRPLRPTRLGRARIRFFVKRRAASTPTTAVRTETGSMRVSTPEATALDLVRYAPQAASLSHVATVLSELSERIAPLKLLEAARAEADLASAQRLGYLLDTVQAAQLTGPLAKWISRRRPRLVALRPDRTVRGASQDRRWRVIVNEKIEAES